MKACQYYLQTSLCKGKTITAGEPLLLGLVIHQPVWVPLIPMGAGAGGLTSKLFLMEHCSNAGNAIERFLQLWGNLFPSENIQRGCRTALQLMAH